MADHDESGADAGERDLSDDERDRVLADWPGASPPSGFSARVADLAAGKPPRTGWLAPAAVASLLAAAALLIAIGLQRRQASRERAAQHTQVQRASAADTLDLNRLTMESERIRREVATLQARITEAVNSAEQARLRLALELQVVKLRAAAARLRVVAAKVRISTGKAKAGDKKILLDVDSSNATGGINGK